MKANEFPYNYLAYGLNIKSQIPIFGFSSSLLDHPDIIIEYGPTPESLKTVRNQSRFYQSNGEEFILRVKNIAKYYVSGGNRVIIQPEIKANVEDISAYLGGIVMGAIFLQRGLLPLHASSIVYKDKCLIFAGNAGSGKSTLAALFVKSGGKLIADDISVIDFSTDFPMVYPGFPFIKVWKHDLSQLGIIGDVLKKVPMEKTKYYMPVKKFADSKVRIDKIFIIEPQKVDLPEISTLKGIQKFRLKKFSYMANSLNNTFREKFHFEMIISLATKVPTILISRPESEFTVHQLRSVVLNHID